MQPRDDRQVLFIMGPTASGKTDLAMQVFDRVPARIISVDSALIYRDMNIGTAKPSEAELVQYPHALVDIKDPAEAYSAAEFVVDARREIEIAFEHNQLPILVGGTILYFKALADGLAELPEADAPLREALEAEALEKGWPAMHQKLAELDPGSGVRLAPNDSQRIQRALEVVMLTGRSIETFWAEQKLSRPDWQLLPLALMPDDRAQLHQRIATRFDLMVEQGFESEVSSLKKRSDLNLNLPSMRCVGYRQMWQYLDGEFDRVDMREKSLAATRQLAKRQLTWLRGWKEKVTLDPLVQSRAVLIDETLRQIKNSTI